MKTRIALFALALAALPITVQSATAHGYWGRNEGRIAHDYARVWHEKREIARDRFELAKDRLERDAAAARQWQAERRGDYRAARFFAEKKYQKQAEIFADRHELARDRHQLAHERFKRDMDIAQRDHGGWRYR